MRKEELDLSELQERFTLPRHTILKAIRKIPANKRLTNLEKYFKPRFIDPADAAAIGWIDNYLWRDKKKDIYCTWSHLAKEWQQIFGKIISRHRFFQWAGIFKPKIHCPFLFNSEGENQYVSNKKVDHHQPWNKKKPRVFLRSDATTIVERFQENAAPIDYEGNELVTNSQLRKDYGVSSGWSAYYCKKGSRVRPGEKALRKRKPVNIVHQICGKRDYFIKSDAQSIRDGLEGPYPGSGRGKRSEQLRNKTKQAAENWVCRFLHHHPDSITKTVLKEARQAGIPTKAAREALHLYGVPKKGFRYKKFWHLSPDFDISTLENVNGLAAESKATEPESYKRENVENGHAAVPLSALASDNSCDNSKKSRKGAYKAVKIATVLRMVGAKVKRGLSVSEACQEVADDKGWSLASVRQIYYRNKDAPDV